MIPKTMRAVQVTGKEQIEVRERPVPDLFDENSILLRNEAVSICNQTEGTTRCAGTSGEVRAIDFNFNRRTATTLARPINASRRSPVFNW